MCNQHYSLTGRQVCYLGHQEVLPEMSQFVVFVEVCGHVCRGRTAAQLG